jgi:iduronate 2-sulfatase
MFTNNGYYAARVGKIYHYGVPGAIGTDGHDDTLSWQKRINPIGRDKWEEDKVINLTPDLNLGVAAAYLMADGIDEEQTDGMVATEAIKLLSENKDRPFFIAAGFYRPHCPYIAPKKYFDLYEPNEIPLAENPEDDLDDIPPLALVGLSRNFEQLDNDQKRDIIRAYYASISFVDAQIGRLLNALDSLGLSQNTIVVFIGDHGYSLGEHYQWQKFNLFEEATRFPMIIKNPAIKSKITKSDHIVEMLDIFPTLADFCGLQPPSNIEGTSMKCLFERKDKNWKNFAITEVARPADTSLSFDISKANSGYIIRGKSVRTKRWRYTEWDSGKSGLELYDHKKYPGEFKNLALQPGYERIIKQLKGMLK